MLLKINYIVGRVTYEKGKFDDAVAFLDTVTPDNEYYPRAQYLKGVVLARQKKKSKDKEAAIAFEKVLAAKPDKVNYTDFEDIHDLALLGAARVAYGSHLYQKSVGYYEAMPRFSKYWDQALFENGWARFQNEDLGGALGSLQALHAPQFEGSFQPESWILKATVYFFSCLYDETKFALKEYEDHYLPMAAQIQPILEGDHDLEFYAHLLDDSNADKLPPAVRNYLLVNARLHGFLNFLAQLDREKEQIEQIPGFRQSAISQELEQAIDQQKVVLTQVTGKFIKDRLAGVVSDINGFKGKAAIIRFETTKAEKEVLESGTDISKRLASRNRLSGDARGRLGLLGLPGGVLDRRESATTSTRSRAGVRSRSPSRFPNGSGKKANPMNQKILSSLLVAALAVPLIAGAAKKKNTQPPSAVDTSAPKAAPAPDAGPTGPMSLDTSRQRQGQLSAEEGGAPGGRRQEGRRGDRRAQGRDQAAPARLGTEGRPDLPARRAVLRQAQVPLRQGDAGLLRRPGRQPEAHRPGREGGRAQGGSQAERPLAARGPAALQPDPQGVPHLRAQG